jgi:hypothetical protein
MAAGAFWGNTKAQQTTPAQPDQHQLEYREFEQPHRGVLQADLD